MGPLHSGPIGHVEQAGWLEGFGRCHEWHDIRVGHAAWPDDVPAALAQLAPGHTFEVPEVLFAKITDDQRDEWAEKFAGGRS